MRKASANWLGKTILTAVMGLLIVSFAIWGIGDIFRGFGRATLAKVGGTEISIEQFRSTYNERIQQISRRAGRPISPDQARALGFDRQILGQMLAEAAMDERVRQLGLNLSDAEVARQITTDPTFKGPTGAFDRVRFDQMIRNAGYNAGYNESRYTAEQRRLALRRQIAETVSTGVSIPQVAAAAYNRYQNEQRSIDYVILDRPQAGDIAPPSPEVLTKYFEDRKVLFRAPEYRKLTVLSLTPADLVSGIEVTDADAKRVYDERSARYITPERRQVEQIVFPNAEEAKAAADRIAGGLTFAQLAAERKLSEKDIDLGLVTKASMVDRAVADAAFALKDGETSAPVNGRFGTALVHVTKIEPEQVRKFEEVAAEIKREVALERARAELAARHDKIEDERAAGNRLDEVAQKLGLQVQTINVDRSGRDPSGNPVPNLPRGVEVIPAAFESQVGVENDPLQVPGGGYVWFEVASVDPSRERTFEEVRSRVEARWRDDQVATVLKDKAADMVAKLKTGTPLAELAAQAGVPVQSANDLKRQPTRQSPPAKVLDEVFRTDKDAAGTAEGDSATQRYVFRVTNVTVPTFDAASPEGKQMQEELRRSMSEDILGQYVARLQSDLGASINNEALRQVVGGERN